MSAPALIAQANGLLMPDEDAAYAALLARPRCRVFLGAPERFRPDRSVVMAGGKASGFIVAIECRDGDHRARAQAYIDAYRRLHPS